MAAPKVELGFAEEAEAWRLQSEQFPCKAGGRPAWLGEAGLPGPERLRCGSCGRPCAFLLQLYALFLFACRHAACYGPPFRNQLSRKNDTYSYDPPPEEPPLVPLPSVNLQLKCGANLCRVCGCLGPKRCSKCHKAHYCSQDHQLLDWKAGHKASCLQSDGDVIPDHKFLFPEYEIVRELEEFDTSINEADKEDVEKNEDLVSFLEAMAKHETQADKIFQKFKERISLEPEQIIRYCRNVEGPLWISEENIPQETDIPKCSCGSKRVFEFQVRKYS
uniref:Programmed cell death 2 n=1 Tax=Anolis carolinensis TaxID=28377 RepID=G1KAW1_ANOCA